MPLFDGFGYSNISLFDEAYMILPDRIFASPLAAAAPHTAAVATIFSIRSCLRDWLLRALPPE